MANDFVQMGASFYRTLALAVVLFASLRLSCDIVHASEDEPSQYWLLGANYSQLVFSSAERVFLALSHDHHSVDYLDPIARRVMTTVTLPSEAIPFKAMGLSNPDSGTVVIVLLDKRLSLLNVLTRKITIVDCPQLTSDPFICGAMPLAGDSSNPGACVWIPPLTPYKRTVVACGDARTQSCNLCSVHRILRTAGALWLSIRTDSGIYQIEPPPFGTNLSYVQHFNAPTSNSTLSAPCPAFLRQRQVDWGQFYAPRAAWFSLDGALMFFSNGMTMTVSEKRRSGSRPWPDIQQHKHAFIVRRCSSSNQQPWQDRSVGRTLTQRSMVRA